MHLVESVTIDDSISIESSKEFWIWQAAGSAPGARCSGITAVRCGCGNFDSSIWRTDAARNTTTTATISAFLTAINIGNAYRTDGFGNPITAGLITKVDGTSAGPAPPAPSPKWTWSVALPPYGGTVGVMSEGRWVYSQRVIYPQ